MSLHHVVQQLNAREIDISIDDIFGYANQCPNEDAAFILRKNVENLGDKCILILIVRNGQPVTVQYRRMTQTNTAQALHVNRIINLA